MVYMSLCFALELYQSQTRAELELYQSQTRAELELYQSQTRAKLELYQSLTRAELKLYQYQTKAELELYQSPTRDELELYQSQIRAGGTVFCLLLILFIVSCSLQVFTATKRQYIDGFTVFVSRLSFLFLLSHL